MKRHEFCSLKGKQGEYSMDKFERHLEQQIAKYKRSTRNKCDEYLAISKTDDVETRFCSWHEYKKYEAITAKLEHVLEKYKTLQQSEEAKVKES